MALSCWQFTDHDIGFLSTKRLPEHERVHRNLFSLAEHGKIREEIEALPDLNFLFSQDDASNCSLGSSTCLYISLLTQVEQEAAFTLFSILAGAYVNNPVKNKITETAPIKLPYCIAYPLDQLAKQLNRQPIWDYAGCVLGNWKLVDSKRPISLENIEILKTSTNLLCEIWFYKIHVVIEAYGGQALVEVRKCMQTLAKCSTRINRYKKDLNSVSKLVSRCYLLKQSLETIAACVQLMKVTFGRMNEHCRAKDFFVTLRPWLSGWPNQGVIYEGVSEEPQVFGGGSGAQSSLLPSLDAFFGVSYMDKLKRKNVTSDEPENKEKEEMKEFVKNLKRFRSHMPPEHAKFLEELEDQPSFRNFIALCNEVVKYHIPAKADPSAEKYIPYENAQGLESSAEDLILQTAGDEVSLPLFVKERQRMEIARLQSACQDLKASYNYAIESMLSFRRIHVGFAASYITTQAKKMAKSQAKTDEESEKIKKKATIGTGGSSFTKHFMSHIKDTRRCLYKVEGRPRNEHEVDVELVNEIEETETFRRFETLRDQVERVKQLRNIADIEKDNESEEE